MHCDAGRLAAAAGRMGCHSARRAGPKGVKGRPGAAAHGGAQGAAAGGAPDGRRRRRPRRRRGAVLSPADSIAAARLRVTECTACQLCEGRTHAVPGRGAAPSKIMLVGEAPGRSEDLRGEPFVGAAGARLDEALKGAGLDRGSVYITNVVKCRPPGNRAPSEEEGAACRAHLEAEMSIVRPSVVCVMGNTALGALLGLSGISRHRGTTVRRGGTDYFITVHPAATIYNRAMMPALMGDMKRLAAIARGEGGGRAG